MIQRIQHLVLTTGNDSKRDEMEPEVRDCNVLVHTFKSLGFTMPDVDECGLTFIANGIIKGRWCAEVFKDELRSRLGDGVVLAAEDSGAIVDALRVPGLEEAPGVRSKRWFAEGLPEKDGDALRNRELLRRLQGVANDQRYGRYVAALVVVSLDGTLLYSATGECRLWVPYEVEPGPNGFGYDEVCRPVLPDGSISERSFARLTPPEKAALSHRGKACRKLRGWLLAQNPTL